jgi:hypothetical protein
MLATDKKKLRRLGIDLSVRWRRRRAAVIGTYVTFILLITFGETANALWPAHPFLEFLAMIAMISILERIGVFKSSLVKSYDASPGRMIGKYQMVGSLDEWARYRSSVGGFEGASQEQQSELLRKYKVGNYQVAPKLVDDPMLDKRKRSERDRISRWALRQLGLYLAINAAFFTARATHPFSPMEAAIDLWGFSILARTLPQARVFWTEPDPSEECDLRLAKGEA